MSQQKRPKGEGAAAEGATPLQALFQRAASGTSSSSLNKKGSEHVESPPLKKGRSSVQEAKQSPRLSKNQSPKISAALEPLNPPALPQKNPGNRTVEQTYQKKTQLEHILLRPDSYVGSVERQQQDHWIFDEPSGKMVRQKLDYVPALYKIFDEILVNAADNLVRSPKQDTIKVVIDAANGWVSVYNNGSGLPVQVHKEHNCFVPELVFGHLLTSDNYDDDERKVTGGRNGYGAKLTNIFSKKFKLETADTGTGKRYTQVWEDNMGKRHEPTIEKHKGEDFTCVTFYPDFPKFGVTCFDKDIVALMSRRAYDVAASTHGKCKVVLNGKELPVKSFLDFIDLHLESDAFRICQVINDRWEVGVGLVPDGAGFQQVSIVNSISTGRGGTHVNMVADQLINPVMDKMVKVKGGLAVKSQHVRGYLMVFVNCLIENPAFDSQTKETLTSKKERFGSQCTLPESMITEFLESGIIAALEEWSKALGKSELAQYLNRSDMGLQKRLFGIPKLEDANKAGTKEGGNCTLILTEGDSAKALAVAGLSVIGRDHYGVFPLRGKLRNVRDLTVKQMLENREIDQIMKIIAMDASKSYDDVKGLRYGSIMIMTDQDPDGSHIKGLIINFLHYWFPSLLRIPGFLKEFVTPIVKVTKGDESHTFFTIPEYIMWKKENEDGRGWKCKYYKGLGTSTSTEAREYFAALEDHEMIFTHEGAEDDDLIDMAFNHSRADDRKTWISRCQPNTYVDHTQATISYNEFINKELVLFAKYDVERMIPSCVDGLKPGQRKVLFGCFKKKITSDIKVAQLSGYVAEHSSYHHGETSLQGTIIGLAQNFVGSNNINLLVPSGQFGTRLAGGKDHAAARYIFTRLSKATRCLFPEEDDPVLEYLDDEGQSIEPKWYCPIIPAVAANGADGIGVGWSCSVPNYNPRELIANVRRMLKSEPQQKLNPWYRNFKGAITEIPDTGKYECCGIATKRGRTRLEISELPVRRWTQDYKEWLLEQLPKGDDARKATIQDVREYHTENSVHFVLSMTPDKLAEADRRGLQKVFHLKSSITTTNMMLFDPNGKIKKYESLEEITKDHFKVRLGVYKKRKAYMLEKMNRQLDLIDNKLRFVQLVVTETLEVEGRKGEALGKDMRKHRLKHKRDIDGWTEGPEELSVSEEMGPLGYRYLVGMKLWTLTEDRLQELKKQHQDKAQEIATLEGITLAQLWEKDLVRLEAALDSIDREEAKEDEAAKKLAKKGLATEMEGMVNRQCVIVLTADFKAKRIKTSEWKAQKSKKGLNRKGLMNAKATKALEAAGEDDEEVEAEALHSVFCCHDFDALLVFTEEGNVFSLQALDVPGAKSVKTKATPIKEFMPDIGQEHITDMVVVPQKALRDQADEFVVLVSKHGLAKKVTLDKFRSLQAAKRGKGLACFKLTDGDKLKWALRGSENSALVMVTSKGFVLRVSLGPDWPLAKSATGGGKKAIKLKDKGGFLASCSVSDLTKEELQVAEQREAERVTKLAQRKVEAEEKAAKEASGETAAATQEGAGNGQFQAGATPVKAKPKIEADDDDSDNEVDDAKDAQDDDAEDVEMEDVEMEDAEDDGEKPTQASGAGETALASASAPAGEVQPVATKSDWGPCLLMITENGWGMRVPFSHKRLMMTKKGRTGSKVMKVMDGDHMCGACIVSGTVEVKKPAEPRRPFQIWYDENKPAIQQEYLSLSEEQRAQMDGEGAKAKKEEDDAVKEEKQEMEVKTEVEADPAQDGDQQQQKNLGAFAVSLMGRRKFRELPEHELLTLKERAKTETAAYQLQMEEYEKEHPPSEQVMVASQHGFISRIKVDTVPVVEKKNVPKGIRVVKIKSNKDCLSSISLLNAAEDGKEDDEPEGEGVAAIKDEKDIKEEPMEEDSAEPIKDEPSSAPVPVKDEPRKSTPKKVRPASLRALPDTPPTNHEAKNSEGRAAAAVLGIMESPGRRISGKKSMADITASPMVSDRGVARPSLEGSRAAPAPAQSRGTSAGRGTSTGRGRGRPAAPKAETKAKQAKAGLVPESPMRRALGKRSLSSLSGMTEPTFD